MTKLSDRDVCDLLKETLSATPLTDSSGDDLWPEVRRTIDRAPQAPRFVEYALIAAVLLLCVVRPSLIQFLLLHL